MMMMIPTFIISHSPTRRTRARTAPLVQEVTDQVPISTNFSLWTRHQRQAVRWGACAPVPTQLSARKSPRPHTLDGKSPSLSAPRPGDVVGAHARRHCVTTTQNDALRLAESPRAYNVRGRARRSDLVDFACQSVRSAPSRSLTERRRSVGATGRPLAPLAGGDI